MDDRQNVSPRFKARVAGFFYLVIYVAGFFSEFAARGRLVVYSDAATTAHNILAHPSIYRLGGVAEIAVLMSDTCVALIFYDLFKPVSRTISLFAAVFRLILVTVMAVSLINYFAPFDLLGNSQLKNAFNADQSHALALTSIQSYGRGYDIALVFFGVHCLLVGYLIFRSTFLPCIFAVLMALAGIGWLTFLWPPFATHLYPYVLFPGAFGEGLLTVWLLVAGVNPQRWREQAAMTRNLQW